MTRPGGRTWWTPTGPASRQRSNAARPHDVVVIAGKGHETGQELVDRTIPFDDRIVARGELAAPRLGASVVINIMIAGVIGLVVSALGTPIAVRRFRKRGWGQLIREEGPKAHYEKRGTPPWAGS